MSAPVLPAGWTEVGISPAPPRQTAPRSSETPGLIAGLSGALGPCPSVESEREVLDARCVRISVVASASPSVRFRFASCLGASRPGGRAEGPRSRRQGGPPAEPGSVAAVPVGRDHGGLDEGSGEVTEPRTSCCYESRRERFSRRPGRTHRRRRIRRSREGRRARYVREQEGGDRRRSAAGHRPAGARCVPARSRPDPTPPRPPGSLRCGPPRPGQGTECGYVIQGLPGARATRWP